MKVLYGIQVYLIKCQFAQVISFVAKNSNLEMNIQCQNILFVKKEP